MDVKNLNLPYYPEENTSEKTGIIHKENLVKNFLGKFLYFLNNNTYFQIFAIVASLLLNTDNMFTPKRSPDHNEEEDNVKDNLSNVLDKRRFFSLYFYYLNNNGFFDGFGDFLFYNLSKTTPIRCFLRIISMIFGVENNSYLGYISNIQTITTLNIVFIIGFIIYKVYKKSNDKLRSLFKLIFWGCFTSLLLDFFILIIICLFDIKNSIYFYHSWDGINETNYKK